MNTYQNELYHYGIPGMKWGVRKSYKPTNYTNSVFSKLKAARRIDVIGDRLYRQHNYLNRYKSAKNLSNRKKEKIKDVKKALKNNEIQYRHAVKQNPSRAIIATQRIARNVGRAALITGATAIGATAGYNLIKTMPFYKSALDTFYSVNGKTMINGVTSIGADNKAKNQIIKNAGNSANSFYSELSRSMNAGKQLDMYDNIGGAVGAALGAATVARRKKRNTNYISSPYGRKSK